MMGCSAVRRSYNRIIGQPRDDRRIMSERQSDAGPKLLELTFKEATWPMAVPRSSQPERDETVDVKSGRGGATASLVDRVFNWLATRIMSGSYRPGEALSELA